MWICEFHDPLPVFINKVFFLSFLSVCFETCLSWHLLQCRNPSASASRMLRSQAYEPVCLAVNTIFSGTGTLVHFATHLLSWCNLQKERLLQRPDGAKLKIFAFWFLFFYSKGLLISVIGLDCVTHNVQVTTTRLAGSYL